eukprot:Awhi_evm1s1841
MGALSHTTGMTTMTSSLPPSDLNNNNNSNSDSSSGSNETEKENKNTMYVKKERIENNGSSKDDKENKLVAEDFILKQEDIGTIQSAMTS